MGSELLFLNAPDPIRRAFANLGIEYLGHEVVGTRRYFPRKTKDAGTGQSEADQVLTCYLAWLTEILCASMAPRSGPYNDNPMRWAIR